MCDTFINVKRRESALTFSAKDETVNCLLAPLLGSGPCPGREAPPHPQSLAPSVLGPRACRLCPWARAREVGFNELPGGWRGSATALGAAGR